MVIELNDETFDQVLAEEPDKLTVVDFWAPWCGPCRSMGPVIEELSHEMPDVRFCKVNCDECEDSCGKAEIRSLPTFVFYKNGKIEKRLSGGMPKAKLADEIKALC